MANHNPTKWYRNTRSPYHAAGDSWVVTGRALCHVKLGNPAREWWGPTDALGVPDSGEGSPVRPSVCARCRRHVRAARERELALMGAALNLASDAADAAVAYPINAEGHVECSAIATEADALWNLADRGGLTVAEVFEAEGRVGALRERLAAWEGK